MQKRLRGEKNVGAEKIRAARALLSWSRETLAHEAGIGLRTMARMEQDHGEALPETVGKVMAALEAAGIEFTEGGVRRNENGAP